ncbi:MAG: hypothetical protein EXR29_14110 [Betaproteobacteria bacterium]|nr:hypothetical protein [Betaproteobacteria bacterium]
MSIFRIVFALFLGVISTTAVAQRALVPIIDYKDISVAKSSDKPVAVDQVKGAIVAAGKSLQWDMAFAANSGLVGTLVVRNKHTISVDISVVPGMYSIKYRSSINMKYADAATDLTYWNLYKSAAGGPVIHPRYNQWVQALKSAMDAELRKL